MAGRGAGQRPDRTGAWGVAVYGFAGVNLRKFDSYKYPLIGLLNSKF